jgi:hypothetical protein
VGAGGDGAAAVAGVLEVMGGLGKRKGSSI